MQPAEVATYYLIVINLFAFAAFGVDKALAQNGGRRVRESSPIAFALLGGTPGAYAGRRAFRHKTRKQPFSRQLLSVAIGQGIMVVFALTFWLSG
ncbi:DUF1294 domain-containing protein [Erythrobacter arachoides]|uniref:DUF1294 domain-containing protein n=1 Tax=Aurantiacibacter arachoides TaxID=1850444 RepID=A0A844ZWH3_9SPHN|nr:DUF1294 domain-containing protein [Aurantiacibacter arachoides]MXO92088.1 DUF1294 domain-containing protein [Aurantiacibacter arachoides]GGD59821.1 hypothetical protein GCM10011411_20020 [Aurantiacibacter arachoides]